MKNLDISLIYYVFQVDMNILMEYKRFFWKYLVLFILIDDSDIVRGIVYFL